MANRNINDLRPDVADNCLTFLHLCKAEGLNVLLTETTRSPADQLAAFNAGYSKTKVPTFHADHAGLAFDICKNVKGQEYVDLDFFRRCGEIGKAVGFTWGGDWKSFPDRPHFQWDEHGKYSGKDILAGRYPGIMPAYKIEEVNEVSEERIREIVREEIARAAQEVENMPPSEWAKAAWSDCVAARIMDGTKPRAPISREQVATVVSRILPDRVNGLISYEAEGK